MSDWKHVSGEDYKRRTIDAFPVGKRVRAYDGAHGVVKGHDEDGDPIVLWDDERHAYPTAASLVEVV